MGLFDSLFSPKTEKKAESMASSTVEEQARGEFRTVRCDICGAKCQVNWDPENGYAPTRRRLLFVTGDSDAKLPWVLWCADCRIRVCGKHIKLTKPSDPFFDKNIALDSLDKKIRALADLISRKGYRPTCPKCGSELFGLSYGEYQEVLEVFQNQQVLLNLLNSEAKDRKAKITKILVAFEENPFFKNLGEEKLNGLKKNVESLL